MAMFQLIYSLERNEILVLVGTELDPSSEGVFPLDLEKAELTRDTIKKLFQSELRSIKIPFLTNSKGLCYLQLEKPAMEQFIIGLDRCIAEFEYHDTETPIQ